MSNKPDIRDRSPWGCILFLSILAFALGSFMGSCGREILP